MSNWITATKECTGAMPKKSWLTNGGQEALFKPDTPRKHESYFEYEASRIAEALGIPCAKIEIFEHNGKTGTLSYNVHEPGFTYIPVTRTDLSSNAVGINSKALPMSNIAVEDIRNNPALKPIEKDTVDMLFLDTLIKNCDRHGNNGELKFSDDGETLLGIAPLFVHGNSQLYAARDNSAVCFYSKDKESITTFPTFPELFKNLCEHYPEQIGALLEKCENIELNAFCAERFKEMKEEFSRSGVQKINPTPTGRETKPRESLDSAIKRATDRANAAKTVSITTPSKDEISK
jgi:hypothetical protein